MIQNLNRFESAVSDQYLGTLENLLVWRILKIWLESILGYVNTLIVIGGLGSWKFISVNRLLIENKFENK